MAMRMQLRHRSAERPAGVLRHQDLAAIGDRHHARRRGLGRTVHLERLGAAGHIGAAVLAQHDRTHMQPGARAQRWFEPRQRPLVGQRISDRVAGGVEQQQHAVGLVDFAAAPMRQQVARQPVVGGPQAGAGGVAERLGELGAVHHVGQQKCFQFAHAQLASIRWRRVRGWPVRPRTSMSCAGTGAAPGAAVRCRGQRLGPRAGRPAPVDECRGGRALRQAPPRPCQRRWCRCCGRAASAAAAVPQVPPRPCRRCQRGCRNAPPPPAAAAGSHQSSANGPGATTVVGASGVRGAAQGRGYRARRSRSSRSMWLRMYCWLASTIGWWSQLCSRPRVSAW